MTLYLVETSIKTVSAVPAYVNVLTRGDLSSLKWIESPLRYFKAEDNPSRDLCSVYYTSLNFRDIMLATGKLPPDAIPGMDHKHESLLCTSVKFKHSLYLSALPNRVFSHFYHILITFVPCTMSRGGYFKEKHSIC